MIITNTFSIHPEFLEELHKRLKADNRKIEYSPKSQFAINPDAAIPTLEHLEEIISVLFWASTQAEEGRLSRFRVSYSKAVRLSSLGLDFDKPIAWNLSELKKIAPSVIPPDGGFCVYPDENGKLSIQGMQTKDRVSDPIRLIFEIIEPARLIVQFPFGRKVAEIKAQSLGFIDNTWNLHADHLLSLSRFRPKLYENSIFNNMREILYSTMTKEILRRIRLLGRGGSLIFIPTSYDLLGSIEPMKYKCSKGYNAVKIVENRLKKYFERKTFKFDRDYQVEVLISETIGTYENKDRMSHAARTVAYLTTVDGATILNDKFEVVGFGAKIVEPPRTKLAEMVKVVLPLEGTGIERRLRLREEFRGKRHLSLARFVLKNPETIGLAISQDGGITGFAFQNGQFTAYRDLELLL